MLQTSGQDRLELELSEAIRPTVEGQGYFLFDLEVGGDRGTNVLRISVDRDGGITLDECAVLSRDIGFFLETSGLEDKVRGAYRLEVGSPGIFRRLRHPQHYTGAVGQRVRVKRREAPDGRYTVVGTLTATDGESIVVQPEEGGEPIRLELHTIKQAALFPQLGFESRQGAAAPHGRNASVSKEGEEHVE